MTPVELSRTVLHAVRRAVDEGELSVTVPERAVVTPPGPGGCGDYATNIALRLARAAEQPPRRVAEILRVRLLDDHRITDVVVTGAGFLNLSLGSAASVELVDEILRRGRQYGHAAGPSGNNVRLRCPAEVRAVVVADATARLLRSQGDSVRISYDGRPAPEWESVLGVDTEGVDTEGVDTAGADAPSSRGPRPGPQPLPDFPIRPVPAPADPLALGRDAARWALLYPAAHDLPRITGDHLVQRETNPLFRVRYAHARTRALLHNAADLGFDPEPGPAHTHETAHTHDTAPLIAALGDHPRVLTAAATDHTPDRLARHLVTVADATLPLLSAVLPLGEEKPSAAHRSRLALAEAAGTVLAGGLALLGIDAPDHL
ncbi:ArgS-related anticodon-binding protein NrtL [Streptomyces sp. NPDC056948]|uniref:ArgS-related anticodon-binding protein NrtL n=1 Tax=Streptomyces sp. NPDC056948 TaxID=3345975 RepID=UPI0036343F10